MINMFCPKVPILFVGAPGTGKTAKVKSHFDYSEVILTSTLTEEDIGGLPYRDGDYDYRTTPAIFRRLHDADKNGKTTVLFLDELDKARRSVADTLLTLIASRKVGNSELPSNTCIVAAANPPEFGGGDGISEAMQSRFSTIEYIPDIKEWVKWARENYPFDYISNIINAIDKMEIPIFDVIGEGLNRRITSPRTISMAIESLIFNNNNKNDHIEMIIKGLLTPASASHILHLVNHQSNDVLDKSISSVTISNNKKINKPILRI